MVYRLPVYVLVDVQQQGGRVRRPAVVQAVQDQVQKRFWRFQQEFATEDVAVQEHAVRERDSAADSL